MTDRMTLLLVAPVVAAVAFFVAAAVLVSRLLFHELEALDPVPCR